jgi:ATP-dependent helicase HrpB
MDLPVVAALPSLQDALARRRAAVLVAPPGSGKTTRVPIALLAAPWLDARRIVMLEPRRLAARAAASYMASLLREAVGETVGFRVRDDTRVGPGTRIEVITEGVLTRMLQSDPALDSVGVVIFDEFHERSLHADLGLALCLQSRALLREDLRILVMSATLDPAHVAALLGDSPVVRAEGRRFPVETLHRATPVTGHIEPAVITTVLDAVAAEDGDVLVFLPGAAEIRRVETGLREASLPAHVDVLPLHGSMPLRDQDRAIQPSPAGRRKVVLSTSIAETSLTIEGVRVIVDSGQSRVPRFSPRTGLTRLVTRRVTRASAEQRRGRAGRVGPGVCYRLWTEDEERTLLERRLPEILEADLASLALELAVWGTNADALAWLDAPPQAALSQARELLRELDAIDAGGTCTAHGRELAGVGLHPRLAHMLLRSRALGGAGTGCDLAALLSERDVLRGSVGPPDPDVRLRLDALNALRERRHIDSTVDLAALRRVRSEADRLRTRHARGASATGDAGVLLAFAYPDRIARARTGTRGRFLLRNGRGAAMQPSWPIAAEPLVVAAEVEGHGRDSRIVLAAPLAEDNLRSHFRDQIETLETVAWEDEVAMVRATRTERLGALVLAEAPLLDAQPESVASALLVGVAKRGLRVLPWSKEAKQLVERVRFLRTLDPSWPDMSDDALAASLGIWLAPHVYGLRRLDDLAALDLPTILAAQLVHSQRRELDVLAPTHVVAPTGSRLPINYSDAAAPAVAVRLQELFGLTEGPRIAGGRVPLTLQLLSPAHRPVQVTRDLAGFWQGSYHDVRKDMRGRYPKHAWPEDPARAQPTHRTKPRG